jgi:hypothetical protein
MLFAALRLCTTEIRTALMVVHKSYGDVYMPIREDFRLGRDQDAWAALRGFRYQIDLSILRWLRLKR